MVGRTAYTALMASKASNLAIGNNEKKKDVHVSGQI